jgi:putative pyoverdin transport system ATP-binding/permease protein
MSLLRFLLRESRGVVVLSVIAGIVSGASSVGLIALVHAELSRNHPSAWRLAVAFTALCLLAQIARILAQGAIIRLAQGSVARMALHLCRRILAVPLRQFEELDPASLLTVLTEDIAIVSGALVGIPVVAITLPIVVLCLGYVGWLSPVVLACGVGVAIPTILVFHVVASRAIERLRRAREGQDVLVDHFRSLIDGFRELKIHRGRREDFLDEVDAAAASVRDQGTAGLTLFAAAGSGNQVAYFGVIAFVLFVLPTIYPLGRDVLEGAILAILYIMSPLEVILNWMPVLGRARVSLQKIEALDPTLLDTEALETPTSLAELHGSITLAGVTYAYPRGRDREDFILGPIDLTLRPEEVVFLAGGNGSGKTTLVKLIAGLYTPQGGMIQLDGRAVGPDHLENYRQLFSVVFADGHLFKSLLGLDLPDLNARARHELARFELDHLVNVEHGTFSTIDLSQGQRRRLALLAACLEDRPVYILDEWASNQDPHFKRVFYLEILPELRARGKSVLVISHDEEFFHVADRVVRLDSGRLVEGEPDVAYLNAPHK